MGRDIIAFRFQQRDEIVEKDLNPVPINGRVIVYYYSVNCTYYSLNWLTEIEQNISYNILSLLT